MHRPRLLVIAVILLGLAFSAPEAWSLGLSYSESRFIMGYEIFGGQMTPVWGFKYDFTLSNDTGTDIYELFLDVPLPDSNLLSFSSPTGWGDGSGDNQPFHGPVADTSFVEWYAAFGSELGDGMSLSGFDFVSSSLLTGSITFSANSSPSIAGNAVAVPEPSLMVSLGISIISIVGLTRWWKD